jgi:uncharacterized repeat protein (TIGR01451 family)
MVRRRSGVRRPTRRGLPGLYLELLEARQLLATYTVDSTGDADTLGTLRYAINQANANAGSDTIVFAIPGAGPHVIQPLSALPTITDQVTISGATQDPLADLPQIVLDGSLAGADVDGLRLGAGAVTSASGSIISGLAINQFSGAGIAILTGANSVAIRSNFLGTDNTGSTALPNNVGVAIRNSFSNTVGGVTTDFRNLISGNTAAGVVITGSTGLANVIQANIIGLALSGNSALPNLGPGIQISGDGSTNSGARSNTVGGSLTAARNFIGGNTGPGILIKDAGASSNQIQGNFIGTNTSGTTAIANAVGVEIRDQATSNSVGGASTSLRNVISGNFTADVRIDNADSNSVVGNLIGTNSDGTAAIPGNSPGTVGVLIQNGSDNNTVGGTTSSAANVISGHQDAGVWIRGAVISGDPTSSGNVLQGNVIGAAIGGSTALPNLIGVRISDGARNSTVGGTSTSARNIISGNTQNGVVLEDVTTTGNLFQGNYIGVAFDGTTALANGQNGVFVNGALNSQIGGTVTGAGNTIAFNGGTGVRVDAGTGNAIQRNSIFSNGDLGIIAPVGLQNAPVLTAASTTGSVTTVTGTLNATASTTYTIEFYSNTTPDPSGAGEGQTYLGSTSVTTDSNGAATFSAALSPAAGLGLTISAIAIAPSGNTSQFAQNVTNTEPSADLSVTMTAVATPVAPAGQVPTSTFYTYTIIATNNGPNNVSTVTLTDVLPAGVTFVGATSTTGTISQSGSTITVAIPTLNSGNSVTVRLTIVSPSTIPSGGSITNTATVTAGSGGADPNPGNNSASLSTTVVQGVDLSVEQTINPNPAFVDSTVTIILTVSNLSTVQATNVTLTNPLPSSLTFVSAVASQGTVSQTGGVVTAVLGNLAAGATTGAGASATITIVARTNTTGTFSNTATATATQPQTVANDNISTVTFTIQAGTQPSTTPPKVTSVVRTGTGTQPTRIVLGFDQAMNAASVQRVQNYRLVSAGADGKFGTADDKRIPLRSVTYNATNNTATVTAFQSYSLHLLTRLTVTGTPSQGLRGTNGLFLDGAGNGQQGTNYVVLIHGTGPVTATAAAALAARRPAVARAKR